MEQIHGYLWIWILIWCRSSLNEKINPNSSPTFPRRLSLQAPRRSSLQAPRHKKRSLLQAANDRHPKLVKTQFYAFSKASKPIKTRQQIVAPRCHRSPSTMSVISKAISRRKLPKWSPLKVRFSRQKYIFKTVAACRRQKSNFCTKIALQRLQDTSNDHRQKLSKLVKTCQKVKLVKRSKFVFCCQDTTNDVNKTCLQDNFDRHTQNFKLQIQPRPWWTQQPWWTPTTTADFAKLTRPRMFPIPFSTGQPKPFNFW